MKPEEKKPNPIDCGGCKEFIRKGSRIADRFPVKEDDCKLMHGGGICLCLAIANENEIQSSVEDTTCES